MADSGAAKASGVSGSRPCSHDRSARSMNTMPRGNEPVLFSRSANSTVLSAASTVSGSIPRSARPPIVSAISRSTLSASAGSMPLRPIENIGWRSRIADQDVLQDVEAEGRLDVDDLVDHPVHGDHRFLGLIRSGLRLFLGGPGRIGAGEAFRCAEARLEGHTGVDLDPIEFTEILVQQAQPLVGVIVAVEEQLGVGRVIVPGVE